MQSGTDAKRVGVWLDGELVIEGVPCDQVSEADGDALKGD